MTPQELNLLKRHLPPSLRRALGLKEAEPDPGLEIFRRYRHAYRLRALLPRACAVQWRHAVGGRLLVSIQMPDGYLVEIPIDLRTRTPLAPASQSPSAALQRASRQTHAAVTNLEQALVLVAELARLFPRHHRITLQQ